jgi:hypothetical protein
LDAKPRSPHALQSPVGAELVKKPGLMSVGDRRREVADAMLRILEAAGQEEI